MVKTRVFLSLSRQGNRELFTYIKDKLLDYELEVLEIGQGEYSPVPMLSCDILVIIPPKQELGDSFTLKLGKGQTNEIETWVNNKSINSIIIADYTAYSNKNSVYARYRNYRGLECIQEGNWGNDYSTIKISNIYNENVYIKVLNTVQEIGNGGIPQVTNPCSEIVTIKGNCLIYGTPGPDLGNLEQFFVNKPIPMLALSRARK
jgi:hypothetical protein